MRFLSLDFEKGLERRAANFNNPRKLLREQGGRRFESSLPCHAFRRTPQDQDCRLPASNSTHTYAGSQTADLQGIPFTVIPLGVLFYTSFCAKWSFQSLNKLLSEEFLLTSLFSVAKLLPLSSSGFKPHCNQ